MEQLICPLVKVLCIIGELVLVARSFCSQNQGASQHQQGKDWKKGELIKCWCVLHENMDHHESISFGFLR